MAMPATTIQVQRETLDLLRRLKTELRAATYDDLLRRLLRQRRPIPDSMFGAHPKLKPFEHEKEFHGD